MKEVKVCSVCSKELKNPLKIRENQIAFCYDCWSKTKSGRKKIKWEKCYYSEENLEVWI